MRDRSDDPSYFELTQYLALRDDDSRLCVYARGKDRKDKLKRERLEMFLFNDALNTFYLRLYGVGRMVKEHSDSNVYL